MTTVLLRQPFCQEQEIAARQRELAALESELIDRECYLANLREELSAFEARYIREVGVLYAELDEWNARIAELIAQNAGTEDARAAAGEARTTAEESHAAAHGETSAPLKVLPSPELKNLYRRVTKCIHPDLATSAADRAIRGRLMAQANAAFGHGDAETLQRILQGYEASPESVDGHGPAAELERVLRRVRQIAKRLEEIEGEVTSLLSSDLAKLMAKVETGKGKTRDPLADIAQGLRFKVHSAEERLSDLQLRKDRQ